MWPCPRKAGRPGFGHSARFTIASKGVLGSADCAPVADVPVTQYARTDDGAHIAYQVIGTGPPDVVYANSFMGHIDGHHLRALQLESAPAVARALRADRVDAVLLAPA